jgi:xanthine dehydrogenase accessory factor
LRAFGIKDFYIPSRESLSRFSGGKDIFNESFQKGWVYLFKKKLIKEMEVTSILNNLFMKEIKDIIKAYKEATKEGKKTALATVVHVEGSSYRRPGARMLVTEEGNLTGAISGGCLEGDALRKALLVMTENRTMLVTYDTNDEDDAKLGMGLGCNGIIQVLIEPIDKKNNNNPIQLLKAVAKKRQKAVLVTLFSLQDKKAKQPGTCLLLKEDGAINSNSDELPDILFADTKNAYDNQTSSFKNYIYKTHNLTAFIEFIQPTVSLIIVGAGNDTMPLAGMADILGWETTIVDGRANYAKTERFPSACQVLVSKPEDVLQQITIDSQTVFALMTHNYNYDMAMLKELVSRNVVYIGLLGPKKKLDRIIDELKEEGLTLSEKQLSAIHGPVGLDIGAETSEEIALSIIAEIKAVLSNKEGKQLKNSEEAIHARAATVINEVKI